MPSTRQLASRFLIVAACLGLVAGCLFASPAWAAFPGTNGKIVFTSDRDSPTPFIDDVYTMDANGSGPTRLTTDPGYDLDPAWSADGQKIAFFSTRDGNQEIYVMNADGSAQTRLTTNPSYDAYPSWSPDGQKIAFTSGRDGNSEIYVMNADGSGQTRLTTNSTGDEAPAWSPDGQKIAFIAGRDGNAEVYVMDANGSNATRLTTNSATEFDPNWSPSGQMIAFTTNRDGNPEIYAMNANGAGQTNLSGNPATLDILPAWSPDGQKIVFTRAPTVTESEIVVMDADGSNQTNLTSTAKVEEYPDWQAIRPDRDKDGLLDSWETDGIDSNDDGTPEVDLPAMGADPDHKDIFLEIDVMSGHELSQAGIDQVIDAFKNAPVSNPDTNAGINLHVDNGPISVMTPGGALWGGLSDRDTLAHDDVLGSYTTGGDYVWSEFDTLKAANFSTDRESAFHYVISGHRYGAATEDSPGISRDIEASDLILALAPVSAPAEGSGNADEQATVLMHELGHNLGLHHGGGDDDNYKPNYLSIMNYAFQWGWLRRTNGTKELDYSRFQIPLNENALSEPTGILPAGGPASAYRTVHSCPNDPAPLDDPSQQFLFSASGPVDWNCNTVLDATVGADTNDDGVKTSLTSINDWESLVYMGGGIGSPAGSVIPPATTEQIEAPLDVLIRSAEVLDGPLAPAPVAAPPAGTPQAPAPAKQKCKKGRKLVKGKCRKKKRKK